MRSSTSLKGSLLARLRRGTLEAFLLHACGAGLLFLMQAVVARAVGLSGYGAFSFALTLAGVLAVAAPLGWPTALMRFTSQYVEQRRWGLLRGAFQRAYQTTILSSATISLVLLIVSFSGLLDPGVSSGLRYTALLLPLASFVSMRRKALQALRRIKASIALEEIVLPLIFLSGVLLVGVATASGALLFYAASALAVLILSSFWLWRSLPDEARAAKPEFETRAWMMVALPMMLGSLGQVFMNRAGVLMLGFLATEEAVGLYNAATRIAMLNVFVLSAVNTVAAPMMAASFHGGRPQQTKKVLYGAMLISTLGALPALSVMLLFPQLLLGLFGPEFVDAALPLQILALGQFVNAATGPVGFALLMTGRERAFAATMIAAGAVSVMASVLVIPAYGAVGAAAVTALSLALVNGWQYLLAARGLDGHGSHG